MLRGRCGFAVFLVLLALGGRPAQGAYLRNYVMNTFDEWLTDDGSGACPGWLEEYSAWHAANRGQPGATYLVQHCPVGAKCMGTGDRMHGILFLLRLAAVTKKVFLIVWDGPKPLSAYLPPNKINWDAAGLPEDVMTQLYSDEASPYDIRVHYKGGVPYINDRAFDAMLDDGTGLELFKSTPMVRVAMNYQVQWPIHAANSEFNDFVKAHGLLRTCRCMFQALFRPSEYLKGKIEVARTSLYGQDPHPYRAWHWRQGGMIGEGNLVRSGHAYDPSIPRQTGSRLRILMSVVKCADSLGTNWTIAAQQRPTLLMTDHNILRQWVSEGHIRELTSMPSLVQHVEHGNIKEEAVAAMWTDLMLLAQADCLVVSASGYSYSALWMSNTRCVTSMYKCMREMDAALPQVEI